MQNREANTVLGLSKLTDGHITDNGRSGRRGIVDHMIAFLWRTRGFHIFPLAGVFSTVMRSK